MAAETIAWFLFGHERDDWLFGPGVSVWPHALFWLHLAVWEWREKKEIDSLKANE